MNENDVFVLADRALDRVPQQIQDSLAADALLMQRLPGMTGRNPQ
jgi:hypothetical protein